MLTWFDQFKINMVAWYQHATVWVIAFWGGAYAYWLTLSTVEQQGYYDMIPFGLGKFAPLVLFAISYVSAHGWPQPNLENKIKNKIDEVQIDAATRPTPL